MYLIYVTGYIIYMLLILDILFQVSDNKGLEVEEECFVDVRKPKKVSKDYTRIKSKGNVAWHIAHLLVLGEMTGLILGRNRVITKYVISCTSRREALVQKRRNSLPWTDKSYALKDLFVCNIWNISAFGPEQSGFTCGVINRPLKC